MKHAVKIFTLLLFFTSNAYARTTATKEDIAKVEEYLNNIQTLSADFVQIASNGEKVEGKIHIKKPNKIRMEYNSPSDILIVGNGDYIVYYDKELDEISNIDYEDVPAALILANTVKINGPELKMTGFEQDPGMTKINLQYKKTEDIGPFTLVFSNSPFDLKQWKVITPQSMEVALSLYNTQTGQELSDSLFTFSKRETERGKYKRK